MDSPGVFSSETKTNENLDQTDSCNPLPSYSREFYESGLSTTTGYPSDSVMRNAGYPNRGTTSSNVMAVSLPSIYVTGNHPLLTRPKLLRKKESELSRCKELLLKKTADCANAVCGERFAVEREASLRRKLHDQKCEFEGMKRMERLRNRERLTCETLRLRRERDEAKMMLASRDAVIERLRIRVRQLEDMEKHKETEIGQMRRELETKNKSLKTLLRKLVLAQFSKKKL